MHHRMKISMFFFAIFLLFISSSAKSALPLRSVNERMFLDNNIQDRRRFSFIPDGIKSAMASGLATAVVKTFLQPLDTIKTIQQAQKIKLGPIRAAMQVVEQRGIRGLWSGIGITIVGSTPSVAVYFGVYSSVKNRLVEIFPPELKLVAVAVSAAIGNTFASVLRVPYEVLKQRIQMGRHQSAWEAVVYSCKNDGLLGLFDNGKLSSQILRDVPYAIVTLVSYEMLQSFVAQLLKSHEERISTTDGIVLDKKSNSEIRSANIGPSKKLRDALCGSIAGGLGSLVTTPMDVVKTRMMTGSQFSSVGEAFYRILKEEGILNFFTGVGPRLMHKIPANGLFFLCYEAFKTFLQVENVTK